MAGGRVRSREDLLVIVPEGCEERQEPSFEILKWSTVLRRPAGLFKKYGFIACLPCQYDHGAKMRDVRVVINELHDWMTAGGTMAFLRPPMPTPEQHSQAPGGKDHGVSRDDTEKLIYAFDYDLLPYPGTSTKSESPPQPYEKLPSRLQAAVAAWIADCELDYGVPVFSPPTSLLPLVVFEGDHRHFADLVLAAHVQPRGDGQLALLPSPEPCLAQAVAVELWDLLRAIRREALRDNSEAPKKLGRPRKSGNQVDRVCDYLKRNPGGHRIAQLENEEELSDIRNIRGVLSNALKEEPPRVEKDTDAEGDVVYRAIEAP